MSSTKPRLILILGGLIALGAWVSCVVALGPHDLWHEGMKTNQEFERQVVDKLTQNPDVHSRFVQEGMNGTEMILTPMLLKMFSTMYEDYSIANFSVTPAQLLAAAAEHGGNDAVAQRNLASLVPTSQLSVLLETFPGTKYDVCRPILESLQQSDNAITTCLCTPVGLYDDYLFINASVNSQLLFSEYQYSIKMQCALPYDSTNIKLAAIVILIAAIVGGLAWVATFLAAAFKPTSFMVSIFALAYEHLAILTAVAFAARISSLLQGHYNGTPLDPFSHEEGPYTPPQVDIIIAFVLFLIAFVTCIVGRIFLGCTQ